MLKNVSSVVGLLHNMVKLAALQRLGLEHGGMKKRQPAIIVERRGSNGNIEMA